MQPQTEFAEQYQREFAEWANSVDAWLSTIGGLPEDVATEAIEEGGCKVRVVKRDGICFVCFQDLKPDRINLEVQSGCVVKAYRG